MKLQLDKKYIPILAVFIVGVILLLRDMQLDGRMSIESDFTKATARVGVLTPTERFEGQKMIGEPGYFKIHTPTYFDTVKLSLDILNTNQNIDIGYEGAQGVALQPYKVPLIDKLSWDKSCNEKFCTYVNPLKTEGDTMTYRYDMVDEKKISQIPLIKNAAKNYSLNLLGTHTFIFEVSGDELAVNFTTTGDVYTAEVVYMGEVITIYESAPISIKLSGVQKGFYEVRLRAKDDTVISHITTSHRFVLKDQIHVAKGNYTFKLNNSNAKFVTYSNDGIQDVTCDENVIALHATHTLEYCNDVTQLKVPKGDVVISQRGPVGIIHGMFFSPYVADLVNDNTVPDNVFQIISSYRQEPLSFNLDHTTEHNFLISVPNIDQGGEVYVEGMHAKFVKDRYYIKDYLLLWIQNITKYFK